MKKVLLIMMATAILAACSSSDEEPTSSELTDVTLTFSPYQVDAITPEQVAQVAKTLSLHTVYFLKGVR